MGGQKYDEPAAIDLLLLTYHDGSRSAEDFQILDGVCELRTADQTQLDYIRNANYEALIAQLPPRPHTPGFMIFKGKITDGDPPVLTGGWWSPPARVSDFAVLLERFTNAATRRLARAKAESEAKTEENPTTATT